MRIAWFTHRYYPCVGGSENYGREMVRRFVARGDSVDVLTSDALDLWYFTDPRRRRVPGPREDRVDGARVTRFPVRHYPGQRYVGRLLSYVPHWPTRCRFDSFLPVIPGLGAVRGPYDAVFAVGFPYTGFAHGAWKTARHAGAPLILTPFLHLATPGDPVNRSYTRPHQVRLLQESDLVIVQTDVERRAVEGWGIPAAGVLQLGMGFRREDVTGGDRVEARRRFGITADAWVIGQLGANDPNKGTNDLVRAVARLRSGPAAGRPIHLLLAGPASPAFETFRATLPADADRWMTVLGPIADADRPSFFAALDAFAMPSRTDSFGIVFLEAWANGLPVVAAAAGGVIDVVEPERTGLLVPFGDVEALASALRRLETDHALAARLGQAGKASVARGFTWDDKFDALAAAVDELRPRRGERGRRRHRAPIEGRASSVR
jgi:glycosyltransferase involved in cell wall biosynthesis